MNGSDASIGPRDAFREALPGGVFLDTSDPDSIEAYLRARGFLSAGEELRSIGKAGEGNMNLTLRVVTSRRSFIVKQARPWVEKYPRIQAPVDRALVEIAFYEVAASRPSVRDAMPRLVAADRGSRLLVLEDLGEAQDYTSLYAGAVLARDELTELVDYLVALHAPLDDAEEGRSRLFENREMRALNHEHIFRLPLAEDNELELDAITPGLEAAAAELAADAAYVRRVAELGSLYLSGGGERLLHGDFFPGSWLGTEHGVRVIDPEFCFLGHPAFDAGFMLGHLHLASQPPNLRDALLPLYRERAEVADESFTPLARGFAGVEIMRRLIGVAQLPLLYGLETKRELLRLSRELVLTA